MQSLKALLPILITLLGMIIEVSLEQAQKVLSPILVNPVKYCNSSNDVIWELESNTEPKFFTAAASLMLSSPSSLVSQLATHSAFTLASAKTINPGMSMSESSETSSLIKKNSFHCSAC